MISGADKIIKIFFTILVLVRNGFATIHVPPLWRISHFEGNTYKNSGRLFLYLQKNRRNYLHSRLLQMLVDKTECFQGTCTLMPCKLISTQIITEEKARKIASCRHVSI